MPEPLTEAGRRLVSMLYSDGAVTYYNEPLATVYAIEAEAMVFGQAEAVAAERERIAGCREELAALEHEQWAAWASTLMATERISVDRKRRWSKLLVGYDELSEEMKEHDRKWADLVLAIVRGEQP